MQRQTSKDTLSKDITILNIFKYFDGLALLAVLPLVSKQWFQLSRDPRFIPQLTRSMLGHVSNAMLTQQVYDFPLSRIALQRTRKLRSILHLPPGYIEESEKHLLDEMVVALIEIIKYLDKSIESKEPKTFVNRFEKNFNCFFDAAYRYINYRREGITQHLETQGIENFYKKPTDTVLRVHYSSSGPQCVGTLDEHRSAREKELRAFYQRPDVMQSLSVLKKCAPNLFAKTQSFNEYWATPRNTFSEPHAALDIPPLLKEIALALQIIDNFAVKSNLEELRSQLVLVMNVFNCYLKANKIAECVAAIYGSIEIIAHWEEVEEEKSFVSQYEKNQAFKTSMALGLFLPRKIHYDLLELDYKEEERKLAKLVANPKSTNEEQGVAKRNLMYASIPWSLLRGVGMLVFNAGKLKRPWDEKIISTILPNLSKEYKQLLPQIALLIELETLQARGESYLFERNKILPPEEFVVIETLSKYGSDVGFLNKIVETLGCLDFSKPFFVETYLRIFAVLGECAKYLTSQSQKLMGHEFWEIIAKIRDKITHSSAYLYQLEEVLRDDVSLIEDIRRDLQDLLKLASAVLQNLPQEYDALREYYSSEKNQKGFYPKGFRQLFTMTELMLSVEDQNELRATVKWRKNLHSIKDQVMAIIDGNQPALSVEQKAFFECVEALTPLNNTQKKDVKEVYKNLRQGKPKKLSAGTSKALNLIRLEPESKIEECVEGLIKKLNRHSDSSLMNELDQYGFSPEAKKIWQEKRQKITKKVIPKKIEEHSSKLIPTIDAIIEEKLEASRKAAVGILKHLKKLANLTEKNRSDLDNYWHDSSLCYAVEHHFVRIRVYIEAIRETLAYLQRYNELDSRTLTLNELYCVLSQTLHRVRLYGNNLAHLHDVTEFDTCTVHGRRLTEYQYLIRLLDGLPYGGRENQAVKRLPSLLDEIKRYVSLFFDSTKQLKNTGKEPEFKRFKPYQTEKDKYLYDDTLIDLWKAFFNWDNYLTEISPKPGDRLFVEATNFGFFVMMFLEMVGVFFMLFYINFNRSIYILMLQL